MYNGIDVSVWQGKIDFNKVKNDGIVFVICKAGGSDDGFYKDSRFEENYSNAKKAGLKVGCYYFVGSNFDTTEKGIEHAKHFYGLIKGKTFDYPVFLDLESTTPSQKNGATKASIAFLDYMKEKGFMVGIYASAISGFVDRLDTSKLEKYDKWVAQYSSNKPTFPSKYSIWQYSSTGRINGINGNVDVNICYNEYNKKKTNTNSNTKNNTNSKKNPVDRIHSTYKIKYKNIVEDVVKGKYGNGKARKSKIVALGYDYNLAQTLVNNYLINVNYFNNIFTNNRIKYERIAGEVINGKYGNGKTRIEKLKKLGYDVTYLQDIVNAKLGD